MEDTGYPNNANGGFSFHIDLSVGKYPNSSSEEDNSSVFNLLGHESICFFVAFELLCSSAMSQRRSGRRMCSVYWLLKDGYIFPQNYLLVHKVI